MKSIVSLKYSIDELHLDVQKIRAKINNLLNNREYKREKLQKRAIYTSRIKQLKEELTVQKALLQNGQEFLAFVISFHQLVIVFV